MFIKLYVILKTLLTFMANIIAGMVHRREYQLPRKKHMNVSTMDIVK